MFSPKSVSWTLPAMSWTVTVTYSGTRGTISSESRPSASVPYSALLIVTSSWGEFPICLWSIVVSPHCPESSQIDEMRVRSSRG